MTRDDVLTPAQVRDALQVSASTWKSVRHKLPWSYLLGPRSARIRWGDVLDALGPSVDDLAAQRRRVG